jgi:hypothetical protein
MTPAKGDKGGSFRAVRGQHLPMFDDKLHRHDRGWPRPEPPAREKAPKMKWRTVGILHIRDEEDDSD